MSLLSFLLGEKKKSASVAKERLQIILAHERSGTRANQPGGRQALVPRVAQQLEEAQRRRAKEPDS